MFYYETQSYITEVFEINRGCDCVSVFSTRTKKHMKANILKQIIVLTGCTVLSVGCAHQQNQAHTVPPAATAAVSAPAKPGLVSAYFPIGKVSGSGLLVEKSVSFPARAGQPVEYTYKVSNLTGATLDAVTVNDYVNGAYSAIVFNPQPATNDKGIATWQLGSLGAKESKIITIKGLPIDENTLITCGWATGTPSAGLDTISPK
jgi:uncharacterized repeat protein (TIGR01451 family)